MPRTISLLDRVRIASPCDVPWESMKGDDRTRHCDQCNLNVYNLADLPRIEAERIVVQHEGKMCARMYVREDGTYLANDCPVGIRIARRAAAKVVGLAGAMLVIVMQFACSALSIRPDTNWAKLQKPFDQFASRINPLPLGPFPGGIVMPTRGKLFLGTPAPLPRPAPVANPNQGIGTTP